MADLAKIRTDAHLSITVHGDGSTWTVEAHNWRPLDGYRTTVATLAEALPAALTKAMTHGLPVVIGPVTLRQYLNGVGV